MKLIARYLGKYRKLVALSIFIKLLGTVAELMLPYILEHIIDHVVPAGKLAQVLGWSREPTRSSWDKRVFITACTPASLNDRRTIHRHDVTIRRCFYGKFERKALLFKR